MNIVSHRICTLLIMCISVITLKASVITVGSLKYTLNNQDNTASVSGYIEGVKKVNIPSSINDGGIVYNVTSIADSCFVNYTGLDSVIVPGSVKTIGKLSFFKCSNLISIVLNKGLEKLEDGCLAYTKISSIVFPESLKKIGWECFYKCNSLKRIVCLAQTPPTWTSGELKYINPYCYVPDVLTYRNSAWGDLEHLYNSYYNNGLLFSFDKVKRTAQLEANDYSGDIVVPESFVSDDVEYTVTSFGNQCFNSCKNLTSVKIPKTITSLGEKCFGSCYALKEVALPNAITSLSAYCFFDCKALERISIPQSVVSIDEDCFWGCVSLKEVTIPNSVTSIGANCFGICSGLEKVALPNNLVSLDYGCFQSCSNLALITLPNTLVSLGDLCFYNCSRLTQISVPAGVASLGDYCFKDCRRLDSLWLPNSITSVGTDCFVNVGTVENPCKLIVDDNFSSSLLKAYTGYYGFTNGNGCFVIPVQQLELSSDELNIVSYRPDTNIEVKVKPTLASNKTLKITPADNSIAQIDDNDSIIALKQGETYIDYQTTDGSNLSARLHVKVSFAPTESLSLKSNNEDLIVNQVYHPTITAYPSGANQRVQMVSSDETVVKAYSPDSIIAVSPGVADVRLEAFDNAIQFVTLHVNVYDHTDSITVGKFQESFYVGQTYQLSFTVYPAQASKKVKFSSSDEKIAKVSDDGLITALIPGEAKIRIESFDNAKVFNEVHVIVAAPTESISLGVSQTEIFEGLSYHPEVSILPEGAYQHVKIFSSDEKVAKGDNDGNIIGVGGGETDIRFEAYDNSNIFATMHVKVWPRTVSITPATTTLSLRLGDVYTKQTVEILPKGAYQKLKLESEDHNIASVDENGVITAVNPGITDILYESLDSSKVVGKCRVIVYAKNVVYVGGIFYILNDGKATVTSIYGGQYRGDDASDIAQYYSGTINIPKTVTYNGMVYDVEEIGSYSFYCQNKLQSIYIPSSVKTISMMAAMKSTSLQLVTVEDNSQLVNIGSEAFEKCTGLLRFTFNGTTLKMKSIDPSAFSECTALQRVRWKGESTLQMIDDYAFYRCSSLNHMEMPNSVVRIGKHTFRYNAALTDVTLAKQLSIIDEYAFGECGFSHITLPESLASAQAGAFINNEHLTGITIPAGMEGIGAACFENNTALDSVTFLTNIHTLTVGNNAFNLCPVLQRVNIAHLDSWAETNFNNAKANPANTAHHIYKDGKEILDVVLPQGTQYVNNNAFNGCSYIKSVDMPSSIDHINDDIFVGCDNLTAVYSRAEDVPLFIGVNDPSSMNDVFNRATLYVPFGYEGDYKKDTWWGRFYKVQGFNAATGISGIALDGDGKARYFDLNGRPVGSRPTVQDIYIKVENGKRTKVTIK